MSLKVKLISCISVFMLMIGILIIGVYAAAQQTINLKGSINFEVANKSLYVSDIRMQTEVASEAQTIDNFMPGYINDTLNVNIGEVTSESGSVNLYFDVVNTSSDTYTASATSSSSSLTVSASGTINGDAVPVSDVTTTEIVSGTIVLQIQGSSGVIDIDGITITLDEVEEITITANTNDGALGTVSGTGSYQIGASVTLTANITNPTTTKFTGWQTSDGSIVSTETTYNFIMSIDSPTTYTAIFEEKESYTYQMSVSDGSSSGGISYTITWNVTSPTGGDSETKGNSVTCYEGDTVSVTINYDSSYTYSDEYYEYYYDYYLNSFYGYALDENGDNTHEMVPADGTTLSFTAGEVDETIYAEFSENFYQQEIYYDVAVNNVSYNYNISDSDEFYSEVSDILAGYELYYVNGETYGGYTVIFNDINYYNQSTTNWHYSLKINTSGSYYEYRVDSENHIIYVDITIDVYVNALITD